MAGDGLEPRKVHNGGLSTDATDPRKVAALARRLVRPLRERARVLGYAVALHGSLERDIDLVALPWTERACPPEHLAASMRQVLDQLYGVKGEVGPTDKPHGRRAWAWWIRSWTYVDLSVFPPTSPESLP